MARKREGPKLDPASAAYQAGFDALWRHPLFHPLVARANVTRSEHPQWDLCPRDGWVVVTQRGGLRVHPKRRAEPEEWTWVLAHALLHLGLGHFQKRARSDLWNVACDAFVNRFLADLKIGRRPAEIAAPAELPPGVPMTSENALYDWLFENGAPRELLGLGTAGPGAQDLLWVEERWGIAVPPEEWRQALGAGLRNAVTAAVEAAGGQPSSLGGERARKTPAQRARSWFLGHYPLLGALASAFAVIEDAALCERMEIQVAAVDAEAREVYVNPRIGMTDGQLRFVIAHELLHVGLAHAARCQGREPYLWNVACDYVINGWLVEMEVGEPPAFGVLYDPELKGLSAEAVYDRIVTDLRKIRKLGTLRGPGLGDILPGRKARWWEAGEGVELDQFYRSCLGQGLLLHQERGRGYLPANLIEEIEALAQPPIPWDVELAQWFDHHFPPLEKRRTFARASRRQMATPDIPRPLLVRKDDGEVRTFAVLLDTSGSMDRRLLAKALGAIASYSTARDVDLVRLLFCDAAVYDQGFVRPEEIAGRVRVRGRGGTILQPGLDLLDESRDFPPNGPVLIITDGYCDVLRVRREHAFLVPGGNRLPFVPRGPVFWVV